MSPPGFRLLLTRPSVGLNPPAEGFYFCGTASSKQLARCRDPETIHAYLAGVIDIAGHIGIRTR